MKHINLLVTIVTFAIFVFDLYINPTPFAWVWFISGLLNLAEWVRYTVTRNIIEHIDKRFGELK